MTTLEFLRLQAQLSIEALAYDAELPPHELILFEAGSGRLPLDAMVMIAGLFKLAPQVIFGPSWETEALPIRPPKPPKKPSKARQDGEEYLPPPMPDMGFEV